MGSGDHRPGALFRLLYVHYINLDMVALPEFLAADLFTFRQHGFGLSDLQGGRPASGVDPFHGSGNQFLMPALEFLHHLSPFAVTDALTDNIPGGLRGDPAKLLGIQLNPYLFAYGSIRIDLPGIQQGNFPALVLYLFHNGFLQINLEHARIRIHVDNRVVVAVIAAFTSGKNRFFDLIQHKIHRNASFLFQQA